MRAKLSFTILGTCTLLWLIAVIAQARWQPQPPSFHELDKFIQAKSYTVQYDSFFVTPDLESFSPPPYPHVEASPTQIKHYLVMAKERYDGSEDSLFYAHKRIAEILKFHNSLKFEDWEKQLVLYKKYLDAQKAKIETAKSSYVKTTLYSQLYRYLIRHEIDLYDVVKNQGLSRGAVSQLNTLIASNFKNYHTLVPQFVQSTTNHFYFPLDIIAQRQYGSYILEVDQAFDDPDTKSIQLIVQDKPISLTPQLKDNKKSFFSDEVEINSANDLVILNYSDVSTSSAHFKPRVIGHETTASAQIAPFYSSVQNNPEQFVLTFNNFSSRDQDNLLRSFSWGWKVKGPFEVTPTQVTYLLEFWPKSLVRVVLYAIGPASFILLILALFFKDKLRTAPKKAYRAIRFESEWKKFLAQHVAVVRKAFSPMRLPLLVIYLGGLFIDVVILDTSNFAPFTAFLIALWIVVAVLYFVRERTHFAVGILFFIMLTIFLIYRKETYAEKLASWAYIFFLAGTIELLIRQLYRNHQKDSIRETGLLVLKDVYRWTQMILRPLLKFIVAHISIVSRLVKVLFVVGLTIIFATNLTYQTQFYERYYKFEPLNKFFYLTAVYELLSIVGVLFITFLLRNKMSLVARIIFFLTCTVIIQIAVFNVSTYEVRTQAAITGMSRSSGTMWSEVVIYGNNFGNAPYNGAAVFVEGVPQRVLEWQNDRIVFVVDPFNTKTGELWVQNVNQRKSNTMKFEYVPL